MGTSTNARQSVERRSGYQLVADIIDNGEVSFQQILVIVLCLIFNMVDGFDITTMAIVATSVSNELGLSADKLGWIFSFALAGMVIGAMGIAPLSDIIGRRKIIIMSLLLVGVSILLTAKASSLTEFIVLRFISGLGAGSMLACQATLASEYSNEKFRALSVSIVVAGYPLGALMTAVVAGYVIPDYGWRGMFWFGGGATVLMSITAMLFIPESLKYLFEQQPAGALKKVNKILVKLKRDTLSTLPSITKSTTAKGGMANNVKALLSVDHRTKTLILWSSFFLGFATLYVLMSWIPKLVEDAGYSAEIGRSAFFWFNLGGLRFSLGRIEGNDVDYLRHRPFTTRRIYRFVCGGCQSLSHGNTRHWHWLVRGSRAIWRSNRSGYCRLYDCCRFRYVRDFLHFCGADGGWWVIRLCPKNKVIHRRRKKEGLTCYLRGQVGFSKPKS